MGLVFFGALAIVPMPETLNLINLVDEQNGDVPHDTAEGEQAPKQSVWKKTVHLVRDSAVDTWTFILGNRRIVLLMLPIMFFVVGRFVQELLLQYATKRYNWSWSKVSPPTLFLHSLDSIVWNAEC